MNNQMIILVGLPGSGKSTFCQKYYPNHIRISQDDLGSKDKCIQKCLDALEANKNVIIDRVNFNAKQRSTWIELGLQNNCESINCIVLEVMEEECIARVIERKNHPTINESISVEKKREIVYNFNKMLEMPSLKEGLSAILILRN